MKKIVSKQLLIYTIDYLNLPDGGNGMKKKIRIRYSPARTEERVINYIPIRYIVAMALALLETLAVIATVILLSYYVRGFYLAVWATEIAAVIYIIASDGNADYKIPWLIVVIVVPVAGLMLYILFGSRKLKKKFSRRLEVLRSAYEKDDTAEYAALEKLSSSAEAQAELLKNIADCHVFTNTAQQYFPLGEDMMPVLLEDLRKAEKFIFMEYFIIEEGVFWNAILEILKEKAAAGVQVKVIYDDIGCMMTLPGNYCRVLRGFGIDAVPFSKLKGNADSEFNNRSHRKITVIDGKVGYTGGINIADEYINKIVKHGHWKDVGLRLEGEAVKELTRLFIADYCINVNTLQESKLDCFPGHSVPAEGFVVPFGDGPMPVYRRRVGQSIIETMLNQARRSVWIMTPYLIIDNELCTSLENAALRGVEVKLVLPHIPDKKLVFEMSRSHYRRLMEAGVQIYEYEPGFVHAKVYLADGETAMVGTINLDYRSLVHHFENGVWMYRCAAVDSIRADFENTLAKCVRMDERNTNWTLLQRAVRAVLKVFAPMM